MITVQCFAHLREQLGQDQITVEKEKLTVKELLKELTDQYAIQTDSLMVAVNEEYAEPEDSVTKGDRVALIPPVSGG
ncbi:molybdopterin converting factor subunit 1 [Jeotgalibacillus proteolyticus]|uniref:Molybdopterin synthase sulfur carrier subunit n=1 Tax=Jeotgalibacillus proteolyticus TaxID=2082395 RepID=A0A2S5GCR9_9BACL|nr:molybdopterin converting factor subunit 1 [Jeotgalibacillus proteolyticus]PPA70711.1 molybdopterin converting factor subunit 1 [Jeotgalibacillus proteolyticus]